MLRRTCRSAQIAVVAAVAGCGPGPGPCPTDTALIERFEARRGDFDALRDQGGAGPLREALGIVAVLGTPPHFAAWQLDFMGAGGAAKGYAWMETPPVERVDDLDASVTCGGPGFVQAYRDIGDGWYLYYASAD